MRGHGIRMGANAAICVVRPGVKKAPIRTGNEDYFVTGHRCRETFDLFPVPDLCLLIHRFSACRPDFRLRIDIEEYGREAAQLEPLVDRGSERKGMLEQLSRIQLLVAARGSLRNPSRMLSYPFMHSPQTGRQYASLNTDSFLPLNGSNRFDSMPMNADGVVTRQSRTGCRPPLHGKRTSASSASERAGQVSP